MALPGPSLYQKRTATRRRTADITRLADQYQRNIEAMTGEYEQAFEQYEAKTAETFKPYEEAVTKYRSETFPAYEAQASQYMQNLQNYQDAIKGFEEYQSSFYLPTGSQTPQQFVVRDGKFYFKEDFGRSKTPGELRSMGGLSGGDYQFVGTGTMENIYFNQEMVYRTELVRSVDPVTGRNEISYPTVLTYEFVPYYENLQTGYLKTALPGGGFTTKTPSEFEFRSAPAKFTDPAPTAPAAPAPPEVAPFDDTQFQARRGQLETEFKREIGQRRGARQRAVSRGGARPLLQGA